ncbi:unnamed protein product [Zymoseptoria tritici ST99CH_3D7]|uniref:Protein BCP1 n=1 Tax=Zymoseptoria tritici (strain ST99CH_3D7) TaxID=1276538 RepID=A0A1X7S2K3_ZYMT9|nr:unnamed protein product [Zymoseptoria tritici ST99CH_3D7]
MSKRKAPEAATKPADKMDLDDDDSSGSDDDKSLLNVDFEWFPPNESVDFHGLKTLLRQLFDVDNQLHELSSLTDLILSQTHIGSTVKCDGEESDPYAFLTALPLSHLRAGNPALQTLATYFLSRSQSSTNPGLAETLTTLLDEDSKANIGVILTERFINMPHQIIPPLYTMLRSEMSSAISSEPQFKFTHYLFLSKTYTEVASQLDVEDAQPSKKSKKEKKAAGKEEVFYFHPEDEVLQRFAVVSGAFGYEKQGEEGASDAKRAFQDLGVRPQGLIMVIEAARFEKAVEAVVEYLSGE